MVCRAIDDDDDKSYESSVYTQIVSTSVGVICVTAKNRVITASRMGTKYFYFTQWSLPKLVPLWCLPVFAGLNICCC
jgi:hypothetical protein